jgi:hypothetical protein
MGCRVLPYHITSLLACLITPQYVTSYKVRRQSSCDVPEVLIRFLRRLGPGLGQQVATQYHDLADHV